MLQGQIKREKVFLFCAADLKLIYFLYMLGDFSVSEVGQQTTKMLLLHFIILRQGNVPFVFEISYRVPTTVYPSCEYSILQRM